MNDSGVAYLSVYSLKVRNTSRFLNTSCANVCIQSSFPKRRSWSAVGKSTLCMVNKKSNQVTEDFAKTKTGKSETNARLPANALVVVALGGNALLKRGEAVTLENQKKNAATAASAIVKLLANGYRVCVTHGNGPQVGLLSKLQPESALYILDAQTEGEAGYLLQLELHNALSEYAAISGNSALKDTNVSALITTTVVDKNDAAFDHPTKPIGRELDEASIESCKSSGFSVIRDGNAFRRAVASPKPLRIVEFPIIRSLLELNTLVVCCGGGGVPVIEHKTSSSSSLEGIDAVVDKDAVSALLAVELKADALLILTDAAGVIPPDVWTQNLEKQKTMKDTSKWKSELEASVQKDMSSDLDLNQYAAGSMRPKLESAVKFVTDRVSSSTTGNEISLCSPFAAIGPLERALQVLHGHEGTTIWSCNREDSQ